MTSATRPLSGQRALIVEDDAMSALAMTEMLAGLGCTIVDVAGGLARGLAAAEFHELDVAVIDIHLGDEKAFRVAHMLMAREVPFVFATAASPDVIPPALSEVPTLSKPFTANDLKRSLMEVLELEGAGPR